MICTLYNSAHNNDFKNSKRTPNLQEQVYKKLVQDY
jgi:hypothetical protein